MLDLKVVDRLTVNDRRILIYEYLDFPITIMLANDVVVGINTKADEISLMVPNADNVYEPITSMHTSNPTLGSVDIDLSAHNLLSTKKFNDGDFFDQKFYRDPFVSLILQYYKR